MPFIWDWIREKLSGTSKITTQPKSLGGPEMDNQVREKVVGNRRKVSTQKGDPVIESIRVRSNNKSKAGGKSTGKAVRAPASKDKAKSKAVSKG
jgi:hypothetical protein